MLLDRNNVGLILRVFATKAEDVAKRVAQTKQLVEKAIAMKVGNKNVFSAIDILVWNDDRYQDADCGLTADALRDAFQSTPFTAKGFAVVSTHDFKRGDLFCGILNYGVVSQLAKRIRYSCIMSPEAIDYLTTENLTAMIGAFNNDVAVAGLAINELTESVLEGRIANTFAIWDNRALMSVGGFDLRAAKPRDDRTAHYLRGWHAEKGDVFYHLAGCEEVIPLAHLVDLLGPCIAPILPTDRTAQYQAPNPATEPDLWARHLSKLGTKTERQSALLASVGYDLSYLKGGVIPAYRNQC